jgi:hypothetical protein
VTAAVVAAHVVILAAIVVVAWLASHRRGTQRAAVPPAAWSGLGVAVALVALFLWSVAASGA